MLLSNARRLVFLIPVVAVLALACGGGDDTAKDEGGEIKQSPPSGGEKAGGEKALEERAGSGIGENQTAANLTIVDGVKQWDGPPKGLNGGLLIVYRDEFRATVEMETVGGQPANGKKFVIDLYHSDFPFFRSGDMTFTVNNFVFLVREGFYDGLPFHRVVPGTLVQTGDPPGPLDGAGYLFNNEVTNKLRHDRAGIVSMANSGVIDGEGTNSSQWFIILQPSPDLDYYDEELFKRICGEPGTSCHTPFGLVIEGMDVVESIVEGDVVSTITVEKLEDGTSTIPSKFPY